MNDLEAKTPDSKRGTHLMVILVLCYGVSFIGAEGVMRGLGDWYPTLNRPTWAPPIALFVPLWTVLYGCVAIGTWQVWEARDRSGRGLAVGFLIPAAILGGAWPWVFFAYRSLLFSTIGGFLFWALTGAAIWAFSRVRSSAALLLLPYGAWAAYLTVLSFAVLRMSK